MTNEGMTIPNERTHMRTVLLQQLQRLGEASADAWERAVFESLTGQTREDVDWDFDDNYAGYYTWIKAFDKLVHELIEDGFVADFDAENERRYRPVETEPAIAWSQVVDPR